MAEQNQTGQRARNLRRKWEAAFLEQLRLTANVSEAAKTAKIGRVTAYDHRNRDPEFRAKWDEACETAIDSLEREAWRRAIEGYEEPVFYQGNQVSTIRKFSDRLLEILLRAKRPSEYRPPMEVTGPEGAPLQTGTVAVYLPDNGRDNGKAKKKTAAEERA
jgi:hypothetical protein